MSIVNRSLGAVAMLLLLNAQGVCQNVRKGSDCTTLKSSPHKRYCLCGAIQICSGDIRSSPLTYGLDDKITVELRNKAGKTIIDSQQATFQTREKQGTTQDNTPISYEESEYRFSFEGKPDGKYVLAFVLYKNGAAQPAVIFPPNYSKKNSKTTTSNSIYMVEPQCPN
jgi:hypothetical protein